MNSGLDLIEEEGERDAERFIYTGAQKQMGTQKVRLGKKAMRLCRGSCGVVVGGAWFWLGRGSER